MADIIVAASRIAPQNSLQLCALLLATCLANSPASAQIGQQNRSAQPAPKLLAAPGLIEQSVMLRVRGAAGSYNLEALIVRPVQAPARLPIAVLTHGKPRLPAEMALIRAELMAPQARDLAYRGYLAVAVVRRGYGKSDGTPGVATNAPYLKCDVPNLHRYFAIESDDLEAALNVVAERPDADAARVIVIGGSVGGGAALALAMRKGPMVRAAINIAGGMRITDQHKKVVCPGETRAAAFGRLGIGNRVPSLWIYSENDDVFSPDIARRAHAAFTAAGGVADLRMIPAVTPNGHNAMELPGGRVHWLAQLDAFLQTRSLPTWNATNVDAVMRDARLSPSHRNTVEKYFSLFTPKVLLRSSNGRLSYTANTRGLEAARFDGTAACEKATQSKCQVVMENFSLVPAAPAPARR
jgi:pimeloyl-ACP methyl ester carboxylesterase